MSNKEKIGSFFPSNFDESKPSAAFFLYEFDKLPKLTKIPFTTVFLFLDDRKNYSAQLQIWDEHGTILINDNSLSVNTVSILKGTYSRFYGHAIGATFRITTPPFTISGGTYKAKLTLFSSEEKELNSQITYFYAK